MPLSLTNLNIIIETILPTKSKDFYCSEGQLFDFFDL